MNFIISKLIHFTGHLFCYNYSTHFFSDISFSYFHVLMLDWGDNWDLEVKARYQTKSQTNKSLHYFHAYAVKDRVVANGMDNKRTTKKHR